ncbi:MAG: RNA degradosome polyphosphate kinase [Lachnospiraceae bacterium]|jgi:polyphosphate kinase|uniref:RNA degradosome polyphosphate kinase n=1 Tax=Parablautia intestinalis TaxID=2320100 RepID=UPI00256ED34B|nr:RNA degradosome polyphosphate kinase [Parablautia intestinalis]MCI9429372.1 RNA degradosome polyphosphate kinase [Lachnospiraceae bacterium]
MAEKEKKTDFTNPKYYTNRELSWILFNTRVLNEARDKSIPLFERLKFLSITASNLDEFFMIRVASLKDMVSVHYDKPDIAGMTPQEQLEALDKATHDLVNMQYSTYTRSLLPLLEKNGLHVIQAHEDLTKAEGDYVDRYFKDSVYPVLTPMAVDSSRPFPLIRNKSLNIGALVKKKGENKEMEFATVQVPSVLPRIVELPSGNDGKRKVILLEEIIEKNIEKLFLNYDIVCVHPFRIMRNADLTIEEDEAADLLKEIEKQLKKRQWGQAIRLEVEADIDKKLLKFIEKELKIKEEDIYRIAGPLDLTFLMKMYGMEGFDHLKKPGYIPQPVPEMEGEGSIFEKIQKGDILLYHPYQTFNPVVEFIKQAAKDPQVLAIKQTLYRVSGNSPIIAALAQAAENGKQVSVLVELKARFDEENNIVWAKMLEKAGCHVIYGLVGLKTHSKITLVVRREEDGIARYVHLGTGNYNDATAKLYTDTGLLTCSESIGEDATAVFNMLSGYSEPLSWNKLSLAPLWLKDKFLSLIQRETEYARRGRKAKMIAKVNSLCDRDIIAALYEASSAGVKIHLIVRGICCLRVGIPGVSENIKVRSIVGNFLEHSRIFYFENDGEPEIYMGSADWMPRNLERRVEILFPVEKEELKQRVIHILDLQLKDTVKANVLTKDNVYEKVDKRGKEHLDSQEEFCREAIEQGEKHVTAYSSRTFIPETHISDAGLQ